MIAIRLAHYNTKRLFRYKGLRVVLIAVPLVVALLRVALANVDALSCVAWLCPLVCALMICTVLHTQWSVDAVSGLVAGLRSCPISARALIASRVVSGACIFALQMVLFVAVLAIRF